MIHKNKKNSFQESQNFYLLDVYAVCDGDREEEIQVSSGCSQCVNWGCWWTHWIFLFTKDPLPVQKLVRKEGRRPAILLGLRDNENDFGVIKVWARKLRVPTPSLTFPVSSSITTEQVRGRVVDILSASLNIFTRWSVRPSQGSVWRGSPPTNINWSRSRWSREEVPTLPCSAEIKSFIF